jgi:hypothetical protein
MTLRVTTALILVCSALFAQEFRATVSGTVTDGSGSAVPSALVKAVNRATNAVTTTKSQKDGFYQVPFLEPGVYDIEFLAPGFQSLKRAAITLEVSQTLNLPVQLTLGQTSQQMTVIGDQEVIELPTRTAVWSSIRPQRRNSR